jgi:hypothetical protein
MFRYRTSAHARSAQGRPHGATSIRSTAWKYVYRGIDALLSIYRRHEIRAEILIDAAVSASRREKMSRLFCDGRRARDCSRRPGELNTVRSRDENILGQETFQ